MQRSDWPKSFVFRFFSDFYRFYPRRRRKLKENVTKHCLLVRAKIVCERPELFRNTTFAKLRAHVTLACESKFDGVFPFWWC